jgi:RNA polymerase sigma-70 factor (ECF subfamily)
MAPENQAQVGTPTPEPVDGQLADKDLARSAQGGDQRAFRALYDANFDFVLRTCRRLGLAASDAEDAVQETFLVASRRLGDFHEGRFSTWLFRIAANVVSARHRKRRVREALLGLWYRRPDQGPPEPDALYEQRDAAEKVAAILSRMAPKKREVFALFELEGLSGAEIAERVGCPVETVWTRLFHARKEFERIARKRGLLVSEEVTVQKR